MLHLADGVLPEDAAPGAELLDGELAAGDDYSLWLSAQRRAQCQAQRQRVLKGLAAAEDDGDLDAALHHAQALLALGAHDESHHTALVREHFLRGEAAAGLAAFQYLEPGSVDPPGHPARPRHASAGVRSAKAGHHRLSRRCRRPRPSRHLEATARDGRPRR